MAIHFVALTVLVLVILTHGEVEQTVLGTATSDIPLLGFGTWNIPKLNASKVVASALEAGYRHLDCAAIYGNEKEVGEGIEAGIEEAEISRSDVWITSKLWNDCHAPSDVSKALKKTLTDLGVGYLDLYLMHWPVAKIDGKNRIDFINTWKAMTQLPSDRVRHVGVSKFSPTQLQNIIDETPDDLPYAHQMELHPYLPQKTFLEMHAQYHIHVTAYSPFANTNPVYGSSRKENSATAVPSLLELPLLQHIADNAGCTTAQAALAWGLQRGTSVIPKSIHRDRIEENFKASKCRLSAFDIHRLETELPVKRFNNPSKSWSVPLYDGLEDAGGVAAMTTQQHIKKVFRRCMRALMQLWERWRVIV